jgi:GH24 family phage-related lysozyme (muramidase)
MTTNINWEFISSLEGKGVKQGYVPSENSGVTIATGFDLKEKTPDFLINELGISEETTGFLSNFMGMSGAEAKEVAPNLQLNDTQVKEIDKASHNWYTKQVIATYNKHDPVTPFEELTQAQQTVLVSVGFQHGTSFTRTDGSDMNYIKQAASGDWDGALANLRNFGDEFPTRRNKEADLLENEKKTLKALEDSKFKPTDTTKQKYLWSELPSVSRGLFLDDAYNDSEYQKYIEEGSTFTTGVKAAIRENTILANGFDMFFAPTFVQEDGFSYENNLEEFRETIKKYNLNSRYAESLVGAVNAGHLEYLGQKAGRHQKNAEILSNMGWTGTALQLGSFILDPVNITGYGALSKVMKGTQFLTGVSRRQNFLRSGLVYGSMEGALYAPVAANNPTMGINDIIIASALGGTLGGGISSIMSKRLNNVATSIERVDIEENGLKTTPKADNTKFKNTKISKENKKLEKQLAETDIDGIDLFYPKIRNIPFLGFSMTRSGTLGTSLSKLTKKFGFESMEEPIGWRKVDPKTNEPIGKEVIVQKETVEAIRDQVVMETHHTVYTTVNEAMEGYLKSFGYGGSVLGKLKGFFQFKHKTDFMVKVKRAMIALSRKDKSAADIELLKDANVVKAAEGYANGFQLWAKKLAESGVEGAEDLAANTGRYYVPRKISFESFASLEAKIGEPGIEELLVKAITSEQKLLNKYDNPATKVKGKDTTVKGVDGKTGEVKDVKIPLTKARAMAKAIVQAAKYNSRHGGFDIEQLIKIKSPELLREYIDDVFSNLTKLQRDDLFNGLKNNISLLTSGRFSERIRLNENFETTINNINVRVDDLFENDIDLLWHSYTNEMSGWYSLSERMGIKSRNQWLKTKNELFKDIDKVYNDPKTNVALRKNATQRGLGNKFIAQEEKDTIDSFFNNIMGRSTETGDPSIGANKLLRDLRRFNFIRVLNQVGVAQLPEYGVAVSQQGIGTMLNEVPLFRKIFNDAQAGELPDTFYKDMAIQGASNGDDHLYRLYQAHDVVERGVSKIDNQGSFVSKPVANAAEKVTGYTSGLTKIDAHQRKIAMRAFVHKLAENLIKVSKNGTEINAIKKGTLNRYRVLGLDDADLIALAKEFNSPNVVTTSNFLGTRVLSFDFVKFKDQALVKRFAIATNRYTKRAVQYNFIGDTSRFFSDNAYGKTMSQFRQFVMVAYNKQFLHNMAMADQATINMFLYTSLIGGLSYVAQANFNAVGMSKSEKKAYLKKKLGEKGDYSKLGAAAFQRAGWSSVMPPFLDMILGQVAPDHRFNTRSSGQEMDLITGNPTYDLIGKIFKVAGSGLKATRSDYNFSKQDLNRIMRLFPYQNLYGVNQFLNFVRDHSGLPDKGQQELY